MNPSISGPELTEREKRLLVLMNEINRHVWGYDELKNSDGSRIAKVEVSVPAPWWGLLQDADLFLDGRKDIDAALDEAKVVKRVR